MVASFLQEEEEALYYLEDLASFLEVVEYVSSIKKRCRHQGEEEYFLLVLTEYYLVFQEVHSV